MSKTGKCIRKSELYIQLRAIWLLIMGGQDWLRGFPFTYDVFILVGVRSLLSRNYICILSLPANRQEETPLILCELRVHYTELETESCVLSGSS